MRKLEEPVIKRRVSLTETLDEMLMAEAAFVCDGNVSLLLRKILTKRYRNIKRNS